MRVFSSSLVAIVATYQHTQAFHTSPAATRRVRYSCAQRRNKLPQSLLYTSNSLAQHGIWMSPPGTEAEPSVVLDDEVAKLRAQAEKARLEAEKLDAELTLQKIESLEKRLNNKTWREKHPDEMDALEEELLVLVNKAGTKKLEKNGSSEVDDKNKNGISSVASAIEEKGPISSVEDKQISTDDVIPSSDLAESKTNPQIAQATVIMESPSLTTETEDKEAERKRLEQNPLTGFDKEDLELYLPVIEEIEKRLSNCTLKEKIEAFQTDPKLQDHFQKKIQSLLVKPIEDMQKLEELKKDYLYSTSTVEKEQIKEQIDKQEKLMEQDGPFSYSDSILKKELKPLSEEELEMRLKAIGELPDVLQAIYKTWNALPEDADMRLAIELDYYESQVQLLEQIRYMQPFTAESRKEAIQAFTSLPKSVQDHVAKGLGLDNANDIDAVINKFSDNGNEEWLTLEDVLQKTGKSGSGSGSKKSSAAMATAASRALEFNDIAFVDRSRYIEEFIPIFAKMESSRVPTKEEIEMFVNEVVDKNAFTVTSKPEPVMGGYYVRGDNRLKRKVDDGNGDQIDIPDNDELVAQLQKSLEASPKLKDKLQFFYVQDPSPPSDEEIDLGLTDRPVLAVTAAVDDPAEFYRNSPGLTKWSITMLGLASTLVYSIGVCLLQPGMLQDYDTAIAAGEAFFDFSQPLEIALAILAIQFAHELGHKIISWKDKFEVGAPTLIPSIQLGLQGGITPFRSPPPNSKSLFDFSIAGPTLGLIASLCFLQYGLGLTASMDLKQVAQLPALPVFLLKSSALGGGLIEFVLGKGTLSMMNTAADDAVLPLHPFAIAGFGGLITNALALLPLGHTDGGRIAVAMFGRRGTFLVNTFTTLILCGMGIFGLDDSRVLLSYVLFCLIWQRNLEAPVLNEADELDYQRGLVGIANAVVVALILLPMMG